MNKLLLIPGVLGLIMLAACTPTTPTDTTDTDMSSSTTSSAESSSEDSADARIIDVAVTDWNFSPSTINVAKGEKVIVRLKGGTGQHSFGVADLGINITVGPGETKEITIPTDTAGSFTFRCMIPCGPGHADMKGTIVIS